MRGARESIYCKSPPFLERRRVVAYKLGMRFMPLAFWDPGLGDHFLFARKFQLYNDNCCKTSLYIDWRRRGYYGGYPLGLMYHIPQIVCHSVSWRRGLNIKWSVQIFDERCLRGMRCRHPKSFGSGYNIAQRRFVINCDTTSWDM